MSRRIWLVCLCLLAIGCFPTATPPPTTEPEAEPKSQLRLASTPWPPFTDDAGQPRVALDLVHGALKRAGYEPNTTMRPEGTLTQALRDGEFDGTAAMWRNEEREGFLLFSKPYLENRLVLVGRAGTDVSATSIKGVKGKRLAVVEGYAYGSAFEEADGPELVKVKSAEQNLRALLDGKVDYVLVDALVVHHLQERQPTKTREMLAIGTAGIITRPLHFAVRRELPNAQQIMDAFNAEVVKMLADGSYHRSLDVGWIRADVDGDGREELVLGGTHAGETAPAGGYRVVSPPAAGVGGVETGFFIDGNRYETWEAVPSTYKVQRAPTSVRINLFEF